MAFMHFSLFSIVFGLMFIAIAGFILFAIIRGLMTWSQNNNSPIMTIRAKVVAKRYNVSSHTHHNPQNHAAMHTSSDTTYFVTFQAESGDRYEFRINGQEFGLLSEGDVGGLIFQGSRYKSFAREQQ